MVPPPYPPAGEEEVRTCRLPAPEATITVQAGMCEGSLLPLFFSSLTAAPRLRGGG